MQARQKDSGTHVPYRNSKLTLLLSDALGARGSCAKTLLLLRCAVVGIARVKVSNSSSQYGQCHSLALTLALA